VTVYAAAVDSAEKANEVRADVSFPLAINVTKAQSDEVRAWWNGDRNYMQPAEFIINADGLILSATYSTGPIGRLDAEDAVTMAPLLGPGGLS
jgi:hypothetical protein